MYLDHHRLGPSRHKALRTSMSLIVYRGPSVSAIHDRSRSHCDGHILFYHIYISPPSPVPRRTIHTRRIIPRRHRPRYPSALAACYVTLDSAPEPCETCAVTYARHNVSRGIMYARVDIPRNHNVEHRQRINVSKAQTVA